MNFIVFAGYQGIELRFSKLGKPRERRIPDLIASPAKRDGTLSADLDSVGFACSNIKLKFLIIN